MSSISEHAITYLGIPTTYENNNSSKRLMIGKNLHIIQIGPINDDNNTHLDTFIQKIGSGYSYYLLGKLGGSLNSQPIRGNNDPKDNTIKLFNNAATDKRFILDSAAAHCLFFTNNMITKLPTSYANNIKKITFRNTVCRGGPALLVRNDIGSNYKTVNALFKANNNNKSIDESFKEVLANAANADKKVIDDIFKHIKDKILQEIFPIENFGNDGTTYHTAKTFIENINSIDDLIKGKYTKPVPIGEMMVKNVMNNENTCHAFYIGFIQLYYALHKLGLVSVSTGNDFIYATESFETKKNTIYDSRKQTEWNDVISKTPVQISPIYDLTAILYCLNNIKKGNTETNDGKKPIPSNLKVHNPEAPKANNDALDKYFEFNDKLVEFYESKLNPPKGGGKGKRQHNPMNSTMRDFIQGGGNPNSKREVNQHVKNILKNNAKLSQKVLDYKNNNA